MRVEMAVFIESPWSSLNFGPSPNLTIVSG